MKNLATPEKLIGPAIRIIGMEHHLTLYDLKAYLADSLQTHLNVQDINRAGRGNKAKVQYGEETVNGYLYGRSWPKIPPEDTIKIVYEAFKNALETKGESFDSGLKQKISETIFSIFSNYEKEKGTRFTNHYLINIISWTPAYGNFLLKHWDACSSLTENEIELWEIISLWTEEKRKDRLKIWSDKVSALNISDLFQSVTSPAFYQWLTIRDKDYSESDRKTNETTLRIPKEVDKKLYDLTDVQRDSLLSIQYHMYINEGKIHKKHKLCLPSEIDIILLYKYFLSDAQKAAVLEEVKTDKAAGDN